MTSVHSISLQKNAYTEDVLTLQLYATLIFLMMNDVKSLILHSGKYV